MRNLTTRLVLLLTIALNLSLAGQAQSPVTGRNGMAATAHPLASLAAIEMLQNGGNAIDAAVAAAFTIGVVEPDGSGLGGGGGMVIYLAKEKKPIYINYYGISSENAESLDFVSSRDARTAKSIGVPGTVAGLLLAHEMYGKLPLKKIIEPAVRYARNGFPIDRTLANLILDNIESVMSNQSTASVFLRDGFPLMEGDTLVQKKLADVLEIIGEKGRDGFYKGEMAETFVKGIDDLGGVLTLDDFASYEPVVTEPVTGSYRGYRVLTANVPQSGVSLLECLNMVENADLKALGHYSESATALHILAETEKLVSSDRYDYLADPNFSDVPVAGLISKEYAKQRFNCIDLNRLNPPTYRETQSGNPSEFNFSEKNVTVSEDESAGGHTTHLSVIDGDGNSVALTQTLGLFFGSAQTVGGVLFNCAMTNYSYNVNNVNYLRNRKQCRSSITPTIILKDDKPYVILGSPGAGRITATVLELIVNIIDYGMDVAQANSAPRFFCQKSDDYLHVESGIKPEVRSKLESMGHNIKVYEGTDLFFGGAQVILVDPATGIYYGSADIRRGGKAIGY